MEIELTERQLREREYYEEYSQRLEKVEVCFDPINGKEKRPWNPYWYVYDKALESFRSNRQKLLDFGCGNGAASMVFAKIGYDVYSFDISKNNISLAKNIAKTYGFEDRTHFSVQVGEKLDYLTESFDMIVGIDILHHLDIKKAISECHRLLKRGGIAIFREPIKVPIIDRVRNTRLIKRLVPNGKSFDRHITKDERKLTKSDLLTIKCIFPNMTIEKFNFLSKIDRFIRKPSEKTPSFLEKVDHYLFKTFPLLKKLGSDAVLIMKKECD